MSVNLSLGPVRTAQTELKCADVTPMFAVNCPVQFSSVSTMRTTL